MPEPGLLSEIGIKTQDIVAGLGGGIVNAIAFKRSDPLAVVSSMVVGAITATGQYAIAQALRFTQGSTLAPTDYSTFFWVVMLDFFWWAKTPDAYTLIGAAIAGLTN